MGSVLPRKPGSIDRETFSLAGGLLTILAIGLPWWTAVRSDGDITVLSLLSFGFPPQRPSLGPWILGVFPNGLEMDYRIVFPSVVIDLSFMTVAGLLGIVGFKKRLVRPVAAGLVAGALLVFLIGLSGAIMPPIGPFGWYGNGLAGPFNGIYGTITWGFSLGFYAAAFGLLFLLLSILLNSRDSTDRKLTKQLERSFPRRKLFPAKKIV